MRSPTEVLSHLHEKGQEKTYRFARLYRNLYNPGFYETAYRNIYANGGSMTPGVDGTTMDGMGKRRIERLIATLQDQSYQPQPARRTYIAKQGNPAKKRPLGIPSGNDKLVQEVIRMLLEAIYEPTFSNNSHGFRPRRGCHDALQQIKDTFTGINWFVEGDITACFDSFDHHTLIALLRKRIEDERFIALMWKFLKAGYMEQWTYHETYAGTPQGSGMSPILANIYLHELDMYVEEYKAKFIAGNAPYRRVAAAYNKLNSAAYRFKRSNSGDWENLSENERRKHAKTLRQMRSAVRQVPSREFRDTSFKGLHYTRYADDFIIGMAGSREDAETLKTEIGTFLQEKLHLTLSVEKTKITHSSQRARFLGYDITISRDQSIKRQKNGVCRRMYSGSVKLFVPHEKWASKLREYKAIRVTRDDKGRDHWRATHRSELINRPDFEILSRYNAEVRGLYYYYCIAHNASAIGKFAGLMKHSMLKTFAGKYRTKVAKIQERYNRNGIFTVQYLTKSGMKQMAFYHGGYKRRPMPVRGLINTLPAFRKYERANSLAGRLKAKVCELCGIPSSELEMHQVKRLKSLSGELPWERVMLDKRRKTLAVCHRCHEIIHTCPDTVSHG